MGSESLSLQAKAPRLQGPRQWRKAANPRSGRDYRAGRQGSQRSREGRADSPAPPLSPPPHPRSAPRFIFVSRTQRNRSAEAGSGPAVRLAPVWRERRGGAAAAAAAAAVVERSGADRTRSPHGRRRVRPRRSVPGRFPNAPGRLPQAPPPPGFPPAARLICMARPSPAAIGRGRAPPSPAAPLPSASRCRVPSPERPELRAAGGLLNRGGGGSGSGRGGRGGGGGGVSRGAGAGRALETSRRRPGC